jgi:hypothetical protein
MSQESEYTELTSQAYNLFAENVTAANGRALEYWKSVWQIASRPYASTEIQSGLRENVERANQIVGLTVNELSTSGRENAELGEKLIAHSAKMQKLYVDAARGLVSTGISNMNFVKDTAERQIDDITKRFEDAQSTPSSVASSN